MKKFALIISMLAFAAITIFFISCIKNKKECKSCKMNPNFSLTNTEFFGNSYDFKMYTSSNNDFYFQYKKETDFSKLGDFFAQMNIEKLLDIELGNASINSIVVFSNKIPSQKFKLEKESIKGVLLYVKNGDICVLG